MKNSYEKKQRQEVENGRNLEKNQRKKLEKKKEKENGEYVVTWEEKLRQWWKRHSFAYYKTHTILLAFEYRCNTKYFLQWSFKLTKISFLKCF